MEKYVFVYNWGDEGCSGMVTIPFEYTSKIDFCLMVLDRIDNCGSGSSFQLFDIWVDINIDIERMVYSLDEWFTIFKEI